ncbi:MAG: hypothetical protein JSV44_07090 [Candidatus Zixiibacteriota bacterium]|nr:MAG: hypothetical protein JSV44_07090 [candidate division Zixibacteria bacterium]
MEIGPLHNAGHFPERKARAIAGDNEDDSCKSEQIKQIDHAVASGETRADRLEVIKKRVKNGFYARPEIIEIIAGILVDRIDLRGVAGSSGGGQLRYSTHDAAATGNHLSSDLKEPGRTESSAGFCG